MSTTRSQSRRSKRMAAGSSTSEILQEESDLAGDASMSFSENPCDIFPSVDPDAQIKRFLALGDLVSAEYWADRKYAIDTAEAIDGTGPYIRMASFIQDLTGCGRFERLCSFSEFHGLHSRHLFFAYFYLHALAERRQWHAITQAPIGLMVTLREAELRSADLGMGEQGKLPQLMAEEAAELNRRMQELKLESALFVHLGRAFLFTENRGAASECLSRAYFTDPTCLQAEHLLRQYNLVPKEFNERFDRLQQSRYDEKVEAAQLDPREQMLLAQRHFARGDAASANHLTSGIIEEHGLYQDALLVHIASLVQQRDSERLFLLAHRLVDAQPDCEISWYAVALYYFVCKNNQAAKSFMNKATAVKEGFGEGWLAFGHILAADSEHEQAMNCYLRAARVQERHFEPLLYIAMGHCYTNNIKLAADFLSDAARLAPSSPVVAHEQGALAYTKKEFDEAERLFERAIRLVAEVDSDDPRPCVQLLNRPFDIFWEPLLNNLGHVARRRGRFHDAIRYHQKALLLVPRKVSTISSLGMCYACLHNSAMAAQQFHHALAIKPFNSVIRSALEKMVALTMEVQAKKSSAFPLLSPHNRTPAAALSIELDDAKALKAQLDLSETQTLKVNKQATTRKIQSGVHRRLAKNVCLSPARSGEDGRLGTNEGAASMETED